MKRVHIAVALAVSMLIGSTAFAGGQSFSVQLDAKFISVGSGHWQKHRVTPRRHVRPAPRHIYRAPKQIHRPAPRRIYRAPKRIFRVPKHIYKPAPRKIYRAPKRVYRPAPRKIFRAPKHVYRPAPRRHAKRYAPSFSKWQQQKRRPWKKH